jgi:hypothetical protein
MGRQPTEHVELCAMALLNLLAIVLTGSGQRYNTEWSFSVTVRHDVASEGESRHGSSVDRRDPGCR